MKNKKTENAQCKFPPRVTTLAGQPQLSVGTPGVDLICSNTPSGHRAGLTRYSKPRDTQRHCSENIWTEESAGGERRRREEERRKE